MIKLKRENCAVLHLPLKRKWYVCAALVYAVKFNWRMAIYWLAAATLTACVTYTGGEK